MTGADAALLQRTVIGIDVPTVPSLPVGITAVPAAGPDPRVYIPQDLVGERGQTVTVPVNLEVTEATGITLSSVDLVVEYDAGRFTVGNFRAGTLLQGAGFNSPLVNTSVPGIIRLTMSTASGTTLLPQGTTGSLLLMDFTVQDTATGATAINLRADYGDGVRTTATNLTDGQVQRLTLGPAPTNAATDAVDGRFTIQEKPAVVWHNAVRPTDVNGDGQVTPVDALALINYLNEHGAQNPLSAAGESVVPYYDVNGDGNCTPLDVLLVINVLNQLAAGAEGELAANAEAAAAVWPTAVSPTAAPVAASANPTQAGKTAAASRLTNADNRRTAEVMSSTESLRLQVAESEEALSQADLLSPDDWDGLLDVLARGYPPEL